MQHRRTGFYTLVFAYVLCFAWLYLPARWDAVSSLGPEVRALTLSILLIEVGASCFVFSTLVKCAGYLWQRPSGQAPAPARPGEQRPPVAIVYLCAGDFDREALESLCALEYGGRFEVFVHDDAQDERIARTLDAEIERIARASGTPVHVLRRPVREGGKPGAVNHVLAQVAEEFPFFVLCDNDSIALDRDALERAVPHFDDPQVGGVQFRNRGLAAAEDGAVNRLLARAVEVFDIFAWHQSRHGFMPFLGHNGILRTEAVVRAGMMSPGCFADDIDLSVRMAKLGYRMRYAPDIEFGEKHPVSYESFRRRSFKWAHGCGQILRRHLVGILRSDRITFKEKLGFLEFVGFYAMQALLVLYLAFAWILLPLLLPPGDPFAELSLAGSALVLVAIVAPSIAYHVKERRAEGSLGFTWICSLVYGSTAFVSAAGLLAGLRDRPREWVPTNAAGAGGRRRLAFALEFAFGLALLGVPLVRGQLGPQHPALYLFASVFLFVPLVDLAYRAAGDVPASLRAQPGAVNTGAWLACGLLASLPALPVACSPSRAEDLSVRVRIEGDHFAVDGKPWLVRGMHYSPWPPGTGPMKGEKWPDPKRVDADLAKIAALGVNTVLVHDAPTDFPERAAAHGLRVIHAYYVNWQSIDAEPFAERVQEIQQEAAVIADAPNLVAILVGNEVVEWVHDKYGGPFVAARIREMYDAVKQVARDVPVSHANWPPLKDLDLSFLDFAAFNVYPSWPREVVVAGYEDYLRHTLRPIAGSRPLLITEFGQNSLEADEQKQADVIEDCWEAIREQTAGGVVFSFADEWWKNYDNPIDQGDWWQREYAPDDEMTHDLDPEEYYGVFNSDRNPKPAAARVGAMFHEDQGSGPISLWLRVLPVLALVVFTVIVIRKRDPLAVAHRGQPRGANA